jgi:pimeloyl-ACP methyl ester carboxylesterase
MREALGYDRYGAAGGDWGAFVTSFLGTVFPDHVTGVYLSFPPLGHVGGMENVRPDQYAPDEAEWFARSQRKWWTTTPTHLTVHTNVPQTLAWALNDSPVGLAAWLLERRHNWCDGDFEKAFSRDFLLTTVNLYWLTQSIGPSLRLYADTFPAGLRLPVPDPEAPAPQLPPRISAPTGIGVFPGEVALLPRKVCEEAANLVHWSVLPEGGHFGPAEQPDLYAGELQTFFRSLR